MSYRQIGNYRFERFLDALDWFEEHGFEDTCELHIFRHPDGRWAEVHRDIDNLGRDDSPTGVCVFQTEAAP